MENRKSAAVPCFRCGLCCRLRIFITLEEARRLVDYTGMAMAGFLENVDEPYFFGEDRFIIRQAGGDCFFLHREGNASRCLVHPAKPDACRSWAAGTQHKECRDGLLHLWGLSMNESGELEGPPEKLAAFGRFLDALKKSEKGFRTE